MTSYKSSDFSRRENNTYFGMEGVHERCVAGKGSGTSGPWWATQVRWCKHGRLSIDESCTSDVWAAQ
jgi:hypothetical protein